MRCRAGATSRTSTRIRSRRRRASRCRCASWSSVPTDREVAIERVDGAARNADRDRVVVEAPLQLRARGVPVATIMRTPGHDVDLVRGLAHAESLPPCAIVQADEDAVELD